MARKLSQSPLLTLAATALGTIAIGFGLNAIFRPQNALTFFEFQELATGTDKRLVDGLMYVYGVRDIFMGLAVYSVAYFGDRKALGWIAIAGSGVDYADGLTCWALVGKGYWSRWGFAPIMTAVGVLLLGALDKA